MAVATRKDNAVIFSEKQQRIFQFFAKNQAYFDALGLEVTVDVNGHLVVVALAGTGKTTTILEAINYAPEPSVLLCAFNVDIAAELKKRCAKPGVEAKTLHGTGFALVRAFMGNVFVDKAGARKKMLTEAALRYHASNGGRPLPFDLVKLVTKLHIKGREILPKATEPGSLLDIAYEFDCEPDAKWTRIGYGVDLIEQLALYAMQVAGSDLQAIKRTGIDYSDMIFLPVRNDWMAPLYDMVVVDEAQDMSASQLMLAQGVLAPNGRMIVVGDPWQAIYGFRGADVDSINRLKTELHATELSLNTTYRCGTAIAAFAASLVPDFLSGAAHTGTIERMHGVTALVEAAQNGDYILSRKNAPIATVAMALWRAKKKAYIRGKNIGEAMVTLMGKIAEKSDSVPEFLKRLTTWRDKEIDRAIAAGKEERVDGIKDKAETLIALADGVVGLRELESRITELFTDDGTGDAGRITCSSIHKAKGLEADRVFVLKDTLFLRWKGQTEKQAKEEANLAYVSYSRAKHTLVLVSTEGVLDAPAPPPAPKLSKRRRKAAKALKVETPTYPDECAAGANLGPTDPLAVAVRKEAPIEDRAEMAEAVNDQDPRPPCA